MLYWQMTNKLFHTRAHTNTHKSCSSQMKWWTYVSISHLIQAQTLTNYEGNYFTSCASFKVAGLRGRIWEPCCKSAASVISQSELQICFFFSLFFFITFSSPYFSPLQIHNQSSVLTGRDKTSAASHQACGVPPWLSSQQGTQLFIPAAINDTPVTSCSCSFSSLCWSSSSHMLPSCEMNSTLMTHLCVCVIVSVAIRDR